jgi:hypothetical protein
VNIFVWLRPISTKTEIIEKAIVTIIGCKKPEAWNERGGRQSD